MPEAPAKPTAAQQQDELLLLAEKIGEVSDRLAQIETEFTAQTAPLDAARGTQESALAALNAALAGIKALNYHVLDNNLGAVSKRVESHEQLDAAEHRQLAEKVDTLRAAYSRLNTAVDQRFAQLENQRHELSRTQADAVSELRRELSALREDPRFAAFERALSAAVSEFREPRTFNPRGKWDGQTKYARLDIAELNGNSFVSNVDDNDEKPDRKSTKWTLLARRGGSALGGGATDITGVAGLGATGLQLAQSGTDSEAREILGVSDMVGATASDDGAAGRVHQPRAGDQNKYWRGDGTWSTPATVTAPAASQSTVDAGTADDEFVAPLTLHGYVNPRLTLNAPRARMGSNGATTNRALIAQFGAHGNVAGSACTFVTSPFVLPASGDCAIFSVQQENSTFGSSRTGFGARIVSGTLRVEQWESFTAVARRREVAGFQTTYGGRTIVLVVRVPEGDSTTAPLIYVLGAELASIAGSTGGGGVNYLATSMSTSYFLSARTWPASDNAPVAHLINYDVGADEALRLSRGEPFAGVDMFGGTQAYGITDLARNGDFTDAGTDWASVKGATVNLTSGDLEIISPAGGSGATLANTYLDSSPQARHYYLWELDVTVDAGTWTLLVGGSNQVIFPGFTTSQNIRVVLPFDSGGTHVFRLVSVLSGTIHVTRARFRKVGLLDLPIIQPALATDDATRQGMSRRLLGMYPINYDIGAAPKTIPVRSQDYTAATSVQVLGGPLTNAKQRLVSVRGNSSDSVNLSLGTSSGGTQLINAQAVNGDFDITTFASRIIASGASLYLTFSGNTTASVKITMEDL